MKIPLTSLTSELWRLSNAHSWLSWFLGLGWVMGLSRFLGFDQRPAGGKLHTLLNPGDLYIHQQRQRAVLSLLQSEGVFPLTGKRLLEVGCGSGKVLREFLWFGAPAESLIGVELQNWRLKEAKSLTPHLPLINADGQRLPFPDSCFDLVIQFTVFSSVLDSDVRQQLAAEMRRVLRPGGLLLWYDFWVNPINPQARGVSPAEVRALFPNCQLSFQRLTLAPPIARLLAPYSWLTCYLLERLRVFNTHYLACIKPEK